MGAAIVPNMFNATLISVCDAVLISIDAALAALININDATLISIELVNAILTNIHEYTASCLRILASSNMKRK